MVMLPSAASASHAERATKPAITAAIGYRIAVSSLLNSAI
jgi:hypothetical protein